MHWMSACPSSTTWPAWSWWTDTATGFRWRTGAGCPSHTPDSAEWESGLTATRTTMLGETDARVVIGGQREGYRGRIPDIAEEALLSLDAGQPLFLFGGYGGCARDILETLGLVDGVPGHQRDWPGRESFKRHRDKGSNNGLLPEEDRLLAETAYIEQMVRGILRGLKRLASGRSAAGSTKADRSAVGIQEPPGEPTESAIQRR